MTATETTTRYVDALETAAQVMLDELKAAREERAHAADRIYAELEAAQRRTLGVVRRIMEQPADFAGNWVAMIDAQTEAQAQALDLTSAWIERFSGAPEQVRARVERVWSANRDLLAAGVAASQEALAANPFAEMLRHNPIADFFRAADSAANGASAK